MKLEDELNEQAPWLKSLKENQAGFRTPEGYFDQLEDGVFHQLDAIGARKRPVKPIAGAAAPWWTRLLSPRPALAFGAVLAIMAACWWLWPATPNPDTAPPPAMADVPPEVPISAEEIAAYLLENPEEADPVFLAQALDEELASALPSPGNTTPTPAGAAGNAATPVELKPDDLVPLLDELTEEELEALL